MSDSIFPRSARVGIVFSGHPLYEVLPDPAWKDGEGFGEPLAIAPDDTDGLTDDVCPECYAPLYVYDGDVYCADCCRVGLPS